jgi:phage terminase large subunit-like protein
MMRELCKRDRFFLLVYVLGRQDVDQEWVYARCCEVQAAPDGYIDIWAREHYKSTIVTFAGTIQDILNNPEETFGIFSFNRPIAKAFLRQIKRELESNEKLKALFADIFWTYPAKEAPKWSEDDGIIVKRKGNPKEATVEAWGLVDGQPTSKHYGVRIYNDIVTRDSVSTPEAIKKTTEAWELSLNLGTARGAARYEGTFYHYADTYRTIIDRGAAKLRLYPGTHNGQPDGVPVLLTPEIMAAKRRDMGPDTFAAQILLDPKRESANQFRPGWLRYWRADHWAAMNRYLLVDPAGEKKKGSDYTCMVVVGLGYDRNYYVITWVRDRMNLTEKANALFALHRQYQPGVVGYEKYGMQADIEHFLDRMNRDNYRFSITPLGGSVAKPDRIKALIPLFEQGRVWLPETCVRVDYQGEPRDLARVFINEEYNAFPFGAHDDMLDVLARILDPDLHAVHPQGPVTATLDDAVFDPAADAKRRQLVRDGLERW